MVNAKVKFVTVQNFFSFFLRFSLSGKMAQKDANIIIGQILDACLKVHCELGPGLFESLYEEVLLYELNKRSLSVQKQKTIPVI